MKGGKANLGKEMRRKVAWDTIALRMKRNSRGKSQGGKKSGEIKKFGRSLSAKKRRACGRAGPGGFHGRSIGVEKKVILLKKVLQGGMTVGRNCNKKTRRGRPC